MRKFSPKKAQLPLPDLPSLLRHLRRWSPSGPSISLRVSHHYLNSKHLDRQVQIDVYAPQRPGSQPLPLVIFHDGQDFQQMNIRQVLIEKWQTQQLPPFLLVGIHANRRRLREYGTAGQVDYAKRGDLAPQHEQFVLQELLPFLEGGFPLAQDAAQRTIAGFSLGGLAAFDLLWRNPTVFGQVGIFSGALWWRSQAFNEAEPDANRISHANVANGSFTPGLRFWMQAGTEDETSDRNNNGVIDAIDDTLDLIKALEEKGYRLGPDLRYVEVEEGRHAPATWAKVMPEFLEWALG